MQPVRVCLARCALVHSQVLDGELLGGDVNDVAVRSLLLVAVAVHLRLHPGEGVCVREERVRADR